MRVSWLPAGGLAMSGRWRCALALGLVLGLATPRGALAEGERTRFSLHPSLSVTGVFDDEPLLAQGGSSDLGVWILPRVELGYRTSAVTLGADLGVDVRRYLDTGPLDDEFYRLSGFAEAGLLPGLTVKLENAWKPVPAALGQPEDVGANLVQANRLQGEARYWIELPKGREVEVGGRGTWFLSDDFTASFPGAGGASIAPRFNADFWQTSGFAQWKTPVGPRTSAHVRSRLGFRDFDDGRRSDHLNLAVEAGLVTERIEGLEVELSLGYGMLHFDTLDDRHQPIGKLELRQQLPGGWSWHALGANRFRSNLAGNEVFEATGEVGVEKQLGERADVSASLFVSHFEDVGAPSNLFGGAETELGYRLLRKGRVSVTYRYWRNDGDAGFDDVSQNSVFLRLSYRH